MQVVDGKLYLNRTWKYIYPALRVYGFQPISYLNELIKQGVGISDINFEDDNDIPKIFILVQTKPLKATGPITKDYDMKVSRFFEYIRKQDYYVDDYLYGMGTKCCSHMVVIKFPENFKEIFRHFMKGEYSQMYSPELIKKYFPLAALNASKNTTVSKTIGENLEIHGVLNKTPQFRITFINKVNKDFGLELTEDEFNIDMELDYLPLLEEELFNFKKEQLLIS